MQESVSMHKSPTPVRHSLMNLARSEEEEKRIRETGRTEDRRLMERKAAQQNKTHRRSTGSKPLLPKPKNATPAQNNKRE